VPCFYALYVVHGPYWLCLLPKKKERVSTTLYYRFIFKDCINPVNYVLLSQGIGSWNHPNSNLDGQAKKPHNDCVLLIVLCFCLIIATQGGLPFCCFHCSLPVLFSCQVISLFFVVQECVGTHPALFHVSVLNPAVIEIMA